MGRLFENIKNQSEWAVKAFASDGYVLDYTIDSFIEIDLFFLRNIKDGKPVKEGRLSSQWLGAILFSIGAYVGETIIKHVPEAVWIIDDNDPDGERTVFIKLPDGAELRPMMKVLKRFNIGNGEAIYPYGHMVTSEYTNQEFNQRFWQLNTEPEEKKKRVWWKFSTKTSTRAW